MAAMKSMFSGPPKPKDVKVTPPDPDIDGPVAQEARRRIRAEAGARGGRRSTILTSGDYARDAMG